MLREVLKAQGFTDEQITAIRKAMSENKIYTSSLENADERYTKLKVQKEDIDKQLETASTTISRLKKTGDNAEKLKTKIGEYENEITRLKGEIATIMKTHALKEQLSKAGVLDPDYLIYKHGGLDKFNFDTDNKPISVNDSIKSYKEDMSLSYLFTQQKQIYSSVGGSGNSGASNPFAEEIFDMTKQGKLIRDNPKQAKELAALVWVTL